MGASLLFGALRAMLRTENLRVKPWRRLSASYRVGPGGD